MTDYGHEETDRRLKKLERKIHAEYEQASKEVQTKLDDYLRRFQIKDNIKREAVAAGEITQEEYTKWRAGQIMIGKRWEEMRDTLAQDLTNTDKIAMSMVKGYMPDVYALNHNYGTFEAEKGSMIDTSYTLYDRQTVENLMKKNPDLLPKPRVDVPKDLRWNKQHITSAITQGILQGEDIRKISKRLQGVTDMDRRAAIRNARTMTTSAENAGRSDSYVRAKEMGIEMEQVWLATLDERTRDSHRELDGEAIKVGDKWHHPKFSNGLRYPGDPDGPPAEVYNCRCTMIAQVAGVDMNVSDLSERNNYKLGGMSYKEWKTEHQKKPKSEEPKQEETNMFGYRVGGTFEVSTGGLATIVTHTIKVSRETDHKFGDGTGYGSYKTTTADVYELDNGMKIYYPSDMDMSKQNLDPAKLAQQIYRMPDGYRSMIQKEIEVLDYRNPQDSYWEKTYGMKGFRSYATGGENISFYADTHHDYDYVFRAIAHEGGHYIDKFEPGGGYRTDRISGTKEWADAVAADLAEHGFDAPTDYARDTAKNNPGYFVEDFAESCGKYISDRSMVETNFPNRTRIIERLIRDHGKN